MGRNRRILREKGDVIWTCDLSHNLSHLHITFISRQALGKLTRGLNMIQNISHTARKSSVREDENMIRVCFVCHGSRQTYLKKP